MNLHIMSFLPFRILPLNLFQALKKDVKDKRKSMSPNIERKNVKGKAKQAKSPRTASLTLDAFFDSFPKKALATAPLYSSHHHKSISLSQQSNNCHYFVLLTK